MEQNRTRDWVISRLAVRTTAPRLTRRRGQLSQVEWNEVDGLALPETEPGHRRAALDAVRPARGRRRARPAGHARQAPHRGRHARSTTSGSPTSCRRWRRTTRSSCSRALEDERAADVLEAMDDDDAADLLGEMSTADQQRLLELMEPEDAEPVRRLMTYADYTAGGMMTSEPVILLPDATVAEALALVRNPELSPAIAAQVFVVRPPQATPTGKFLGTAHLQRLLREPPSALVSGVCEKDTGALRPDTHHRGRHAPPRDLQPRRGPGRRRPRPAARRGLGRRRARPPAARGLARRRPGGGAWLSGAPGSTSRRSSAARACGSTPTRSAS